MSQLDLLKIKQIALTIYRDNTPAPGTERENFLTECWVEAVVGEFNRQGIVDIKLTRDHEHFIKSFS